jgi:hypothetical protein
LAASVWDEVLGDEVLGDEVLDTEHAVVIRTYVDWRPSKDRAPEKVLIIVVEPDERTRERCPECGTRGKPAEYDVVRQHARTPLMCTASGRSWSRGCRGSSAASTGRSPRGCRGPAMMTGSPGPFEEFAAW